jgi:hypothetical protein
MFFNRLLGYAEARGHLPLRQPIDPAQPHCFATPRWKVVEGLGQRAQLLARPDASLGGHFINDHVQRLQIPHAVDGDDALPADPIGDEMFGGGEQKRFRLSRSGSRGGLIHADVRFLAQVVQILGMRPASTQEAHESGLVHNDFSLEPDVKGLVHSRRRYRDRRTQNSSASERRGNPCGFWQ